MNVPKSAGLGAGIEPRAIAPSSLPTEERGPAVTRVRRVVARAVDHDLVLRPDETVVIACSGGRDSSVLLDALARLAPTRGWRLIAVHVDHGLREGADAERDRVAAVADARGVAFEAVKATLPPRGSLQDRARRGRYVALRRVADRVGPAVIVTGHTADDQAETVMWRVISGASLALLGGIAPRRGALARPLLGVWRDETTAYCDAIGLTFFNDPSNVDTRFLRTRIRHELLPLAESIVPGTRRHLVEIAERTRGVRD